MLALEDAGSGEDDSALPPAAGTGDLTVVHLGNVAVDSGQLMVTDPFYVDDEWGEADRQAAWETEEGRHTEPASVDEGSKGATSTQTPPYSWRGVAEATRENGYGELAFRMGHAGAGVVFQTAWGDGEYPVYGEMHDGRIVRVYLNVG